ncbi:MAG: flagellar biosynthetic protein FliO [Thermodesulfobacteriota bacterium]|nr:flagellar biosynthetic protein FliO [Thermodesulfobacteriota bacterium]
MKRIYIMIPVYVMISSPLMAEDIDIAATSMRSMFFLVLMIIALFAVAWALKRYGPLARVRRSTGLDIIGQVPLNTKANLALVRVGKEIVLVGVTQNSITLIKDLGEDGFENALSRSEGEQ